MPVETIQPKFGEQRSPVGEQSTSVSTVRLNWLRFTLVMPHCDYVFKKDIKSKLVAGAWRNNR
jgi:hypothetical protein